MVTALVFLAILLSAVIVHELAHYVNARQVGVRVRSFSVGFGPILFKRQAYGTEWRFSLLPLGGYVDVEGLAPEVDDSGELQPARDGLAAKGWPAKVWVLIGGVIANLILGVFLMAGAVSLEPLYRAFINPDADVVQGTMIAGVEPGSVAADLGLEEGMALLSINGVEDPNPNQVVEAIQGTDGELQFAVEKNAERRTLTVPWPPEDLAEDERPLLGVQLEPRDVARVGFAVALWESSVFVVRSVPEMVRSFASGFGDAITGRQSEDVAGPVGMVSMVNQATQVGIAPVLFLAAVINFSLAIFNLLPIPGLDGGRILVASIAAVRGRPFAPKQEAMVHFIGVMTVLALIVLITVQEIAAMLV